MFRLIILCSFFIFTQIATAQAAGDFNIGSSGPIHIETQDVIILKDKNLLKGDVFVKRGELEARSDELEVYLINNKDIEKLVFKDNVRLNKEDIRAISNKAEFFIAEDRVVLSGAVKVWHGKNYLEGEIITINNKTGEAKVHSSENKRVKIIFNPEDGK